MSKENISKSISKLLKIIGIICCIILFMILISDIYQEFDKQNDKLFNCEKNIINNYCLKYNCSIFSHNSIYMAKIINKNTREIKKFFFTEEEKQYCKNQSYY